MVSAKTCTCGHSSDLNLGHAKRQGVDGQRLCWEDHEVDLWAHSQARYRARRLSGTEIRCCSGRITQKVCRQRAHRTSGFQSTHDLRFSEHTGPQVFKAHRTSGFQSTQDLRFSEHTGPQVFRKNLRFSEHTGPQVFRAHRTSGFQSTQGLGFSEHTGPQVFRAHRTSGFQEHTGPQVFRTHRASGFQGWVARQRPSRFTAKVAESPSVSSCNLSPDARRPIWVTTSVAQPTLFFGKVTVKNLNAMVDSWHPTSANLAEGRSGTLLCNPAQVSSEGYIIWYTVFTPSQPRRVI